MKIAYLITRMDEYGGAQIHVRDLALWLKGQREGGGHEPLVLSGWQGKVSDFLESQDIACHEVPDLVRQIDPVKDVKAFFQIRKLLKDHKPDVLSCHSSKAGLLGRLAAKSCGIPVLFTAHGWAFTEGVPVTQRLLYGVIEKVAGWFSDHIVTVSEYDRALGIKSRIVPPEKIEAVHNGMPDRPAPTRGSRSEPPRLMMVARVGPQKDHARLLRVLWGCLDLPWTLDLIGGGDDLELRQMVADMGYADRVIFRGERDDVPDLMDTKADLYLLISKWEGLPRSILEAMRSGLPVIASNVGGVGEAVVDGVTGLIVPPGEDEPLMTALRRLLEDESLRLQMGAAGRKRFEENFTFLAMATKTLGIYKKICRREIGDR
jgi:glycosyltransferase involved in cell wall biosynthesis